MLIAASRATFVWIFDALCIDVQLWRWLLGRHWFIAELVVILLLLCLIHCCLPGTFLRLPLLLLATPPQGVATGQQAYVAPLQESYDLFMNERKAELESLQRRSLMVTEAFNSLPNMRCNFTEGAMYAFPQVMLPRPCPPSQSFAIPSCPPGTVFVFLPGGHKRHNYTNHMLAPSCKLAIHHPHFMPSCCCHQCRTALCT